MAGLRGLTRAPARSDEPKDDDLGPYLNRVIWPLASLSGIFLALRVYCKLWRRRLLWWDDYVLIASWVCRPQHKPVPAGAIVNLLMCS